LNKTNKHKKTNPLKKKHKKLMADTTHTPKNPSHTPK